LSLLRNLAQRPCQIPSFSPLQRGGR